MNNQILDTPFRDSFSDFLEKGETIVWEGSPTDPEYAIVPVKKGLIDFNRNQIIMWILATIFIMTYIFFYDELIATGASFLIIGLVLLLGALNKKHHKRDFAEYAISTKRVLFKSNHAKQKMYFDLPFDQLTNCIVVEKEPGRGTIFLALKNPTAIAFETFTVKDNGEVEKRHQPTLENIENPQAIAKLIREGIQRTNLLS